MDQTRTPNMVFETVIGVWGGEWEVLSGGLVSFILSICGKKFSCERSIKQRLQLFDGFKLHGLLKFYRGICFQRLPSHFQVSSKVWEITRERGTQHQWITGETDHSSASH